MKILINERLSEHRCKTPEGYLICTDAILARTGKQTYRKNEIFKDSDDETEIEVDRTEDEVFSPQTLASFENKPVTVEHPDEDVNVHNYKEYAVGFVRDVRRGEANGQPVILGNLVITDEKTIQEIENGEHTDLSCGYDCDIADEANPCQRNIRGNHVALCECGRAGIARIVDGEPVGAKDYVKDAEIDRLIEKYTDDPETTITSMSRKLIVELSERDERNTALIGALKKAGFKQLSSFRFVKDSIKDSKEQLFTVEYEQDGVTYVRKVRASSIEDAISKAKDVYNKFEHETDKEYLKSSIDEMSRYIRNWSFMTTREKRNISPEGLNALKQMLKFAQQRLAELNTYFTDSVKDTRMKVANLTNGYAIVPASRWRKFGLNSEVERFTTNLDEARYIRSSLERNDGISFVIVDVTQRRTTDSMKDALIPLTKEAINMFESLLRTSNIAIERKGLTMFGRVHYQVRAFMPFNQFVKKLDRIDNEMNKLGIPMTFNAGADEEVCTAGIDLDKQYVKDSQRAQKIQKIVKVVKSIK